MKIEQSKVLANPFQKRYTVYVPDELNLEILLIAKPIQLKYHKDSPREILDRAYYLLGQIYNSKENLLAQGGVIEDGWTRLNSKYLKKIVGNYKQYITYFLDNGILECDGSYSNNSRNAFSMSYRFNPKKFKSGGWKSYHIYGSFYKSITNHKSFDKDKEKYTNLYNWFSDLEIDSNEAYVVLNDLYPDKSKGYNFQDHYLHRLNDPNLWTFKTCKTNRLFTPITSLKKELRHMLTYKGEPLKEVDIKSSIPYFSLILLSPKLVDSNPVFQSLLVSSNKPLFESIDKGTLLVDSITGTTKTSPLHSYYKPDKLNYHIIWGNKANLYVDYDDVRLFKDDIIEGDIYSKLANKWNTALKSEKYDRDGAKKKFLSILNSPFHYESKEKKILENLYPNVMNTFRIFGNGYMITKSRRKNNKQRNSSLELELGCPFAVFTQKLESYFLLDVVCKRISEEYPHVPLYTVHDSILTTKDNLKMVKYIMIDESLKLFDSKISVNIQH